MQLKTLSNTSEAPAKIRSDPQKICPIAMKVALREKWGEWRGLNPRPPEPQPGALPTELHSP